MGDQPGIPLRESGQSRNPLAGHGTYGQRPVPRESAQSPIPTFPLKGKESFDIYGHSPVPCGHDIHGPHGILSNLLMLVLARVLASTCLTITAQYKLYFPSAEGRLPET